MKVLLLTDVPPCDNYTAGLALQHLVGLLRPEDIALCTVANKNLTPRIPNSIEDLPSLFLQKPRESSVRILPGIGGALTGWLFERLSAGWTSNVLLPKIERFARTNRVEAVWVVLQGQTMVRIARPLANALGVPLFTQVWDPFSWWLRENRVDGWTRRSLFTEFDRAIRHSSACATASWAMSLSYNERYGVKNTPVIVGLPREFAIQPAETPHPANDFVIGMAGQFYSQAEWSSLIDALNKANWTILGRNVRIRVLGRVFSADTQCPANFEYLGWQSQSDSIRLLAEADLLYMPYWFSSEFREESSNSFPSKLITYFATGRPVFCHAPAYSSPAKYIIQNQAGYLCDSLDPLFILQSLERVLFDTDSYSKYSANGAACFLRDFTLESTKSSFDDFFSVGSPARSLLLD